MDEVDHDPVLTIENSSVIETLEELLEKARLGEIFAIATVSVAAEGFNEFHTAGLSLGYRHRLLSGLTELQIKVALDLVEEE
jgi:hypothetical protein